MMTPNKKTEAYRCYTTDDASLANVYQGLCTRSEYFKIIKMMNKTYVDILLDEGAIFLPWIKEEFAITYEPNEVPFEKRRIAFGKTAKYWHEHPEEKGQVFIKFNDEGYYRIRRITHKTKHKSRTLSKFIPNNRIVRELNELVKNGKTYIYAK